MDSDLDDGVLVLVDLLHVPSLLLHLGSGGLGHPRRLRWKPKEQQ